MEPAPKVANTTAIHHYCTPYHHLGSHREDVYDCCIFRVSLIRMLPLEKQINVIGFSRMLILYGSAVVFEIVVEEV